MTRAAVLLTVVLSTCAAHAHAQTVVELTLDDAVARGLAASHRLAESAARRDAADARGDVQHAPTLPQVAALAGYTRTNHVEAFGVLLPNNQLKLIYPDIPDNYRTRLDLQWPIYTGGRIDALERAARAEAGASADDLATARSDLTLEITRAYWALVTAIESERVVGESAARVAAHLRDVRNRFAAGLLPPNDVSSAEAQESRQRMLTAQAHATREIAEADLARLVGVGADAVVRPVSSLTPPAPVDRPAPALVDEARANRADRAALVKRLAATHERQQAAAAGHRPTVAVAGGVDYASPNPRIFPRDSTWRESWDAGVSLSWPIFDGGRTRADLAEAAANARAAEARLGEADSVLALEVRQRWLELDASRTVIAAADDSVRSAVEARRVVGDRFSAGASTSTDVLDAQVAVLQAELDRTQAIAAARLAEARLARALGR